MKTCDSPGWVRPLYRWLYAALCMLASGAAFALSVTSTPSSCQNTTGTGTQAWSNPGRAVASDNSYATASVSAGQIANWLECTGYGFTIIDFRHSEPRGIFSGGVNYRRWVFVPIV